MLEARLHASSLFVTLTYDEANYPRDSSVSVREAQLFLKRLRQRVFPVRFRYFIVGEYGESTWRAHYHACLFGLQGSDPVEKAWTLGFVHCGEVTPESAAYIAGYTVKKLTRADDVRLKGRAPEFARMSLRPGIGAGAVEVMRDALVDSDGVVVSGGAVPTSWRDGKKMMPLGRYLRRRLHGAVGLGSLAGVHRRDAELVARASEVGTRNAVEERERARGQHQRNAAARARIQRSKKGQVL